MRLSILSVVVAILLAATPAAARVSNDQALAERIEGNPKATVTLVEYASLTCTHCAEFQKEVLPELRKKYVETGKVRLVFRDFPIDGTALRAAALARCVSEDRYFAFISILFDNQQKWAFVAEPEAKLLQYAVLAGLPPEDAKSCMNDQALLDGLVARRHEGEQSFSINATPTFVINNGAEKLVGARSLADFDAVFDRLFAAKK